MPGITLSYLGVDDEADPGHRDEEDAGDVHLVETVEVWLRYSRTFEGNTAGGLAEI